MKKAIRFGVLLGVRHAAHQLADYWLQPHEQSQRKGEAGCVGAAACARHVTIYTLTNVVVVGVAGRVFELGLSARGIAAGEVVSAVSHYLADRREHGVMIPLARRIGKARYIEAGGAPALDQSWHHVWNAVAAAVTAVVDDGRRGHRRVLDLR